MSNFVAPSEVEEEGIADVAEAGLMSKWEGRGDGEEGRIRDWPMAAKVAGEGVEETND